MINSTQHTTTITCAIAPRVWHCSAFHCHCSWSRHSRGRYQVQEEKAEVSNQQTAECHDREQRY